MGAGGGCVLLDGGGRGELDDTLVRLTLALC